MKYALLVALLIWLGILFPPVFIIYGIFAVKEWIDSGY